MMIITIMAWSQCAEYNGRELACCCALSHGWPWDRSTSLTFAVSQRNRPAGCTSCNLDGRQAELKQPWILAGFVLSARRNSVRHSSINQQSFETSRKSRNDSPFGMATCRSMHQDKGGRCVQRIDQRFLENNAGPTSVHSPCMQCHAAPAHAAPSLHSSSVWLEFSGRFSNLAAVSRI